MHETIEANDLLAASDGLPSLTTGWEVDLTYFNNTATEREWVRTKLAPTWEAAANIRFTGLYRDHRGP